MHVLPLDTRIFIFLGYFDCFYDIRECNVYSLNTVEETFTPHNHIQKRFIYFRVLLLFGGVFHDNKHFDLL